MADFARILAAVDAVLGSDGLARYLAKQGEAAVDTLSGDPFLTAAADALAATFTGTATELLVRVPSPADGRTRKGWPTTARQVTQVLKRQAPTMRKAGWTIHDDGGANHDKVLRWTITPPARPEMVSDGHPQDPQDPHTPADQREQGSSVAGAAGAAGDGDPRPGGTPAPDPRPASGIRAGQRSAAGVAGVAYGQDDGFLPLTGPCRCRACGWHVGSQGHRADCTERRVG